MGQYWIPHAAIIRLVQKGRPLAPMRISFSILPWAFGFPPPSAAGGEALRGAAAQFTGTALLTSKHPIFCCPIPKTYLASLVFGWHTTIPHLILTSSLSFYLNIVTIHVPAVDLQ